MRALHWRTFKQLTREHDALVEVLLAAMAKRLGLINGRLARLLDDLTGEC